MKFVFIFFFILSNVLYAQNLEPFQIYNKKGRKINVKRLMKQLESSEIILFGELHDNPIAHWLQLKTIQYLGEKSDLSLGAEMLETHMQKELNAYLNNELTQEQLDTTIHLWTNYQTDYKPLVDYAKTNKIPFIATNIPRKYASFVYRNGFEALEAELSDAEKLLVAPLPIAYDPELPNYKAMLSMMSDHANPNFPKAQAIKDATMAYFIYQEFQKNKNQFVHFNGDYHSKDFEGIYWYLRHLDKDVDIKTISTVEQENIDQLDDEFKGQADFIIVVDADMTKTY
ncbi:iron-regulated protein [Brumimicrobium salinarum]|uniref:Iron-regulated protein n=1 Tax=Brumimicrobium salinarum TaxID=2058658 RepID=A0A2I0R6P3_9FLAO|nr:ChaN family lipoprotein [Brumimicrobium salinarum]PKR82256.1 iron-regulated protein [Brumimicrobium salinarum]